MWKCNLSIDFLFFQIYIFIVNFDSEFHNNIKNDQNIIFEIESSGINET